MCSTICLTLQSYLTLSYTILYYTVMSYTVLAYCVLSHPILSCPMLSSSFLYCIVMSYTVLSYPILSYPILFFPILYCHVLYCPILSCSFLSYPVLYCTVLFCTVLYCTVLSCPTCKWAFQYNRCGSSVRRLYDLSVTHFLITDLLHKKSTVQFHFSLKEIQNFAASCHFHTVPGSASLSKLIIQNKQIIARPDAALISHFHSQDLNDINCLFEQ